MVVFNGAAFLSESWGQVERFFAPGRSRTYCSPLTKRLGTIRLDARRPAHDSSNYVLSAAW